jgi:hypothetical protein
VQVHYKDIIKLVKKHLDSPRIVLYNNGDQIKYDVNNEIEWVFSPRYGWNEIPEEIRKEFE